MVPGDIPHLGQDSINVLPEPLARGPFRFGKFGHLGVVADPGQVSVLLPVGQSLMESLSGLRRGWVHSL